MSKRWWLVAAVVVLVLGAWMLRGRGPSSTPTTLETAVVPEGVDSVELEVTDVTQAPVAAGEVAGESRVPVETAAPAGAAERETPDDDTVVVTAKVVDERSQPLAGVALTANVLPDGPVALSDEEGELRLELPWTDGIDRCFPQSCGFTLRRHGLATTGARRHFRAPENAFLGTITMVPGGGVAGRVVDEEGRPVVGASIGVVPPPSEGDEAQAAHLRVWGGGVRGGLVFTGDDGSFLLEALPAQHLVVTAKANRTFCAISPPVTVEAAAIVTVDDLVLKPAGPEHWIEGVVLSVAGRPVTDERISLLTPDGNAVLLRTKSSFDGGFHFTVLANETYMVEAGRPGHDRLQLGGIHSGTTDVVLQYRAARTFRARVEAQGERPLQRITGGVSGVDGRGFVGGHTTSVEGNMIELLLPDKPFKAWVSAYGYAGKQLGPFDPADMPEEVVFTLEPAVGITGRVVANGAPVADARLDLHPGWRRGISGGKSRSGFFTRIRPQIIGGTTTLENGRFFLQVEAGSGYLYGIDHFYVHAFADGLAHAERGPFVVSAIDEIGELEIELSPGGSLAGRLVGPEDFDPRGWMVVLSRGDGHFQGQVVDEQGGYRFTDLPAGDHYLQRTEEKDVESMGAGGRMAFQPWKGEIPTNVRIVAGRETRFDLEVEDDPTCRIVGSFTLNGAAPAGWTWTVYRGRDRWPVGAGGALEGTTKLVGRQTLLFSPPRSMHAVTRFSIVLDLPPGELRWERDVPVGSIELVGLHLPAPSREDSERDRSIDEYYTLTWEDGSDLTWRASIYHATDGRLRLDQVPAGDLHLRHGASGLELDIQLAPEEHRVIELPE